MNLEIPQIVLVLVLALLLSAFLSLLMGPRGGRFRALPGWIGFWAFFGVLLVLLSRTSPWISVPLLGIVMFGSLKEYFFLAPVRPQDRWAILFAYFSIPASLYPVFVNSYGTFLTIILLALFLLMPAILSIGSPRQGLLDSMGRVLLGLLVFVFCAAHLAWMVHLPTGFLELFGVLVLASELPQRLAGRFRLGERMLRSLMGVVGGVGLSAASGAWLGPWVGVSLNEGAIAGILVATSVTIGGLVTEAVAQDLSLGPSTSRVGRAAILDRITPVIYAAPLFFHFLN